ENSETIAMKVEAHKKDTYAQLLAVLDDGQQAHLQEQIGEPFKGQVRLFGLGGVLPAALQSPTYLSIAGTAFAGNKLLHEELKASEVQIKQLADLRTKTVARTREIGPAVSVNEQYDKLRAEQAKD